MTGRPAYCACLSDPRVRSYLWRYGNPDQMEASWRAWLMTLSATGASTSTDDVVDALEVLDCYRPQDVMAAISSYVGPRPEGQGWERFWMLLPRERQAA